MHGRRLVPLLLLMLLACIVLPTSAHAVALGGYALRDERDTTPWQGCDGVTQNIAIHVQGDPSAPTRLSCNPVTGSFAVGGMTLPTVGTVVTSWLIGAPERGVNYHTVASTSADDYGLAIHQDRVRLSTAQSPANLTTATISQWDVSSNPTYTSDIPVDVSTGTLYTSKDVELHVGPNITFRPTTTTVVGSIHVSSFATWKPGPTSPLTTLIGTGTSDNCDLGPGLSAPLCIVGTFDTTTTGANIEYRPADPFDLAVSTDLSYNSLWLDDQVAGPRALLGTRAGQTLNVGGFFGAEMPLVSDPWNANVVAEYIYLQGYPGTGAGGSWTGNGPIQVTARHQFTGTARIHLPSATVRLDVQQDDMVPLGPLPAGGNVEPDWTLGNLAINSNVGNVMGNYAGNGGITPSYNSGGSNADTPVALLADPNTGKQWALVNQATNSGDWAILRYNNDGTPDTGWNGTGRMAIALATPDSVGAAVLTPNGGIIVGGSVSDDWTVRAFTVTGAPDTSFDTDGVWNWTNTGVDKVTTLQRRPNGELIVGGDYWNGSRTGWRVARIASTGGAPLVTPVTSAFAVTASLRGSCMNSDGGGLVFYGRSGGATTGDWAFARLDQVDGFASWQNFFGASTPTSFDFGGQDDHLTSCSNTGSNVILGGAVGSAGAHDLKVVRLDIDGNLQSWWGTGGQWTYDSGGDDTMGGITTNHENEGVTIAAGDAASGGRATMHRLDSIGFSDTTFGTNGIATWDAGAGTAERAVAVVTHYGDMYDVLLQDGRNGGDVAVQRLDPSGRVSNGAAAVVRVLQQSGYQRAKVHVLGDMVIGDANGSVKYDLADQGGHLVVDGDLTVASGSSLRAPWNDVLKVGGNLAIQGGFHHDNGTVELTPRGKGSGMDVQSTTIFNNLTVTGASKSVAFDGTDPTRVRGVFRVRGESCARPAHLVPFGGSAWTLDTSGGGSVDVRYGDLRLLNASPAVTVQDSIDSGANAGVTFAGTACSIVMPAPDRLLVGGLRNPRAISVAAPAFTMLNHAGTGVDRSDFEVFSSPPEHQVALWSFDVDGTDASGLGNHLTAAGGATIGTGKFAGDAVTTNSTTGFSAGGSGANLPGDFTVDGWFRGTLAGAGAATDIISKWGGAGTPTNYRIGFNAARTQLVGRVTGNTGAAVATVQTSSAPVIDGGWHHLAMTFDSGRVVLYVDGEERASASTDTRTADQVAGPTRIGQNGTAEYDDWRLSNVAYDAAAIRGYFRTGRVHAEEIWDSDPTDTNGTVIGSTIAADNPVPATYGGAADTLRKDGARYWVRARVKTVGGTWSLWSDADWFETNQSMTVSLVNGTSETFGALSPGQQANVTIPVDVQTTNTKGFSLYATGERDAYVLGNGLQDPNARIPGIEPTGNATTLWPSGTGGTRGAFGLTVLSTTDGKDTSRWGASGIPTSYNTLRYGTPFKTTPLLLHNRTSYYGAVTRVNVNARLFVGAQNRVGSYATIIDLTAVPNL